MAIDWNVPSRPSPRVPYLRVKLTDGTVMYCLAFGLKSKTVELILLVALPGSEVVLEVEGADAAAALDPLADILSAPGD